ncbi:signal recognition particle-docking protein FtsY [Actinomyces minihominis]|uniref:signal recognition particle-docking protein FtsY n=1 Tax=Actinomyces minihominis TaxID=2002838 RepID=UPI000C08A5CA|nr:signal recognition particle-docking protein FtsY [Actinomyces minihominis]
MEALAQFFSTPVGLLVAAVILIAIVAVIALAVRSKPKRPKETVEQVEQAPTSPPPEPVETETVVEEVEEVEEVVPELEKPEAVRSRMQRLRARMASSGGIGAALLAVFARGELSASDWEEIEDTLLMADVGLGPTDEIMERLRQEARIRGGLDSGSAREVLHDELLNLVGPDMDRSLNLNPMTTTRGEIGPAAVLVVGVNGTGKTTTVGKMARLLRAEDKKVVLGAADTFRAAASEQLETWGARVGVPVVSTDRDGGDPASVAFDAVKVAIETESDVVIVDTAGRLQTKSALMDELGKIRRVMEKQVPVAEVLLVLDATTGQNGMKQAQVFAEAVGITGIVLTKLDGSAKGGIVIAVQKELGVPVKLVGLGEGPDDLAPFDPTGFVDAIVGQ